MKRLICFILVFALALSFASCGQNSSGQQPAVTYHSVPEGGYPVPENAEYLELIELMIVVDGEDEPRYHGGSFDHVLQSDSVAELVEVCLGDGRMEYTIENGMYVSFDGLKARGTMSWLLYVNDELAEAGATEVIVAPEDIVKWRYTDYTKAFAQ